MTNMKEDLWPADIAQEPSDRAPMLILREQAEKLGEKTANMVEGHVTVHPAAGGEKLMIEFSLVAPALGGYEVQILRVEQPADLYPVKMEFEGSTWVANDEAGFKKYLEALFRSARTRRVVSTLLAQSRSA